MTDSTLASAVYVEAGALAWQPHHNDAINRLEQMGQLGVVNRTTTSAPGSPAQGAAYIVASGATGVWSSQVNNVAAYYSGWIYMKPREGWQAFDQADNIGVTFDANTWRVSAPEASNANRNQCINGAFRFAQRSVSSNFANGYTTVDRYFTNRSTGVSGGIVRQVAITDLDGAEYAFRFQRVSGNTAVNSLDIYYALESADSVQFQGKFMTLSLYARRGANYSPTSNELAINLTYGAHDDAAPASVTAQDTSTATLTTEWQRFSITASSPLASTVTQVGFQIRATPTGTAGANDWFEVALVQLERGQTATEFDHVNYADEFSRCQRYYEKTFDASVEPAQSAGRSGALTYIADGTGEGGVIWNYAAQKRADPTITTYNPANTNANWRNTNDGTDSTVFVDTTVSNENRAVIVVTADATDANDQMEIHATAESEL